MSAFQVPMKEYDDDLSAASGGTELEDDISLSSGFNKSLDNDATESTPRRRKLCCRIIMDVIGLKSLPSAFVATEDEDDLVSEEVVTATREEEDQDGVGSPIGGALVLEENAVGDTHCVVDNSSTNDSNDGRRDRVGSDFIENLIEVVTTDNGLRVFMQLNLCEIVNDGTISVTSAVYHSNFLSSRALDEPRSFSPEEAIQMETLWRNNNDATPSSPFTHMVLQEIVLQLSTAVDNSVEDGMEDDAATPTPNVASA